MTDADGVIPWVKLVGAVIIFTLTVELDFGINWGNTEINGSGFSGIPNNDTNNSNHDDTVDD